MFDPWANYRTTGTWADHASYSLGGIDKPLGYGTALVAPASGVLHTSGRPGPGAEFQCGEVGSAGRRSILMLDRALERVGQPSPVRMLGFYRESSDPMVAIVFQHQSRFGVHGRRYREGDKANPVGWSGASANGSDWGGEVHLHWHGLTAKGERVNPLAYIGSSVAGDGGQIITSNESEEDEMKFLYVDDDGAGRAIWVLLNVSTAKFVSTYSQSKANGWASVWGNARPTPRQEFLNAIDAIKKTS